MPNVQMGNDLKRVKVFIKPNGELQKGTAEDYYTGNNLGGAGETSGVPEKPKAEEKKN